MPRGIYPRKPKKPLSERFWPKVDVCGEDDCWEWTACKDKAGYGYMTVNAKPRLATHVLFYLRKGHWPAKGRTCNHHCDNPPCLNPKHLYLGTQASNARDMVQRGRHRYVVRKGERNGSAKLTEKEVRQIRQRYKRGGTTYKELGQKFDISNTTIRDIKTRRTWSHVE